MKTKVNIEAAHENSAVKVPNALLSTGFRSADEVKRAIRKVLDIPRDRPWQDACGILRRRFRCTIDALEPSEDAWRLVKLIGELSEDIELQILARRALRQPIEKAHEPRT